jgi:CheY-like chemotaxis protein
MEAITNKSVILYAEDDRDDYESLNGALSQESDAYKLEWAKHGEEVVKYLQNPSATLPDLIVLDLNMPIMDGKETLQWLKSEDRFKDIPVMVFTTSSREEDIKLCQGYGCTFFRKPTLYRDLLHIVQTMMKMSANATA